MYKPILQGRTEGDLPRLDPSSGAMPLTTQGLLHDTDLPPNRATREYRAFRVEHKLVRSAANAHALCGSRARKDSRHRDMNSAVIRREEISLLRMTISTETSLSRYHLQWYSRLAHQQEPDSQYQQLRTALQHSC